MAECGGLLSLYRGFLLSRVRIPPSPQCAADIRGVATTDLAWAAGIYDGEGSASTYLPKQRKSRIRQMAVYQSGDGAPPPLLLRFRAVVGDVRASAWRSVPVWCTARG